MKSVPTDLVSDISAYRPDPVAMRDQTWPVSDRLLLLERITTSEGAVSSPHSRSAAPAGRSRKRWPAVVGLAAVAAVALIAVQLMLPGDRPGGSPAANAAIGRLASAAAGSPSDPTGPGQYRHLTIREKQSDGVRVLQSWTAYDGKFWIGYTHDGVPTYDVFTPPPGDHLGTPSPMFLATLPTDPDDLFDYLQSHVSGSNSKDEAIFNAVGDMLRGGFASPDLRAAAMHVLERTSGIVASNVTDAEGRPAVELKYTGAGSGDGDNSVLFDPRTAAVLEVDEAPNYTATYTDDGTVDAVPANVLANAR